MKLPWLDELAAQSVYLQRESKHVILLRVAVLDLLTRRLKFLPRITLLFGEVQLHGLHSETRSHERERRRVL